MVLEQRTRRIIDLLGLILVIGSIMVLIPQIIGFGREGFSQEEIYKQFTFYVQTGTAYLLFTGIAFFVSFFIFRKYKESYGDSVAFSSQGETPSFSYFKKYSNLRLFLICFIIFGVLGLVNFITKQTVFTGVAVGSVGQQFTVVDSLLFSSALIPAAENAGAALVLALGLIGIRFWAKKANIGKNNFMMLCLFLIPILVGIYGVTNHLLRYSSSDIALITVFMFWLIGGLITILTGSFIPFWVLHIMNNLFFDLKRFFSNDIVIIAVVASIIAVLVAYLLVYVRGKNNNNIYKI